MRTGVSCLVLTSILMIGLLAGCASNPVPNAPVPADDPIVVRGSTVQPLAFRGLITDIPGGRILGFHYEGANSVRGHDYRWDESFENRTRDLNGMAQQLLREAGYRIEPRTEGGDVVQLVGTMRKLVYNSYSHRSDFNQASCELRWEMFRAGDETPFYTQATTGEGRVPLTESGAIVAAFDTALKNLLAREDFVEALSR